MKDLYAGITRFCDYWRDDPDTPDASTLQTTYESLCNEFLAERDGCIDAAKAIVECACRVIISKLDDPENPIKEWNDSSIKSNTPSITEWVTAAIRLLKLVDLRNDPFSKVISQHHSLATELGKFRNAAGPLSHGRDGFLETLSSHHRKSAVIAADAIILFLHEAYLNHQFLHEAYLNRQLDPVNSLKSYEFFSDQNAKIDRHCTVSLANIDENEKDLRIKISLPNRDDIEILMSPSEILFSADRTAYKAAFNVCDDLPVNEMPEDERSRE